MTQEVEALARKYLALMEVSRVIASHRDLSELFDHMAESLHQLLGFHYLSVAVHDDEPQHDAHARPAIVGRQIRAANV